MCAVIGEPPCFAYCPYMTVDITTNTVPIINNTPAPIMKESKFKCIFMRSKDVDNLNVILLLSYENQLYYLSDRLESNMRIGKTK